MAKAEVCKTSIHRFDSDRRLYLLDFGLFCVILFRVSAGVVELVDTRDLKSLGCYNRAGSIPALGTEIDSEIT